MRRSLENVAVAGIAVVTAIGLGAPPAAASTWTVSSGGSFNATQILSVNFKDTTTNQPISCSAWTALGNAPNGTGKPGTGIFTLNNGNIGGCSGPLGTSGTGTFAATFNAVSYNTGTTTGTLTGIALTFSIHNILGTCNASVNGSANNVTYSNSGKLSVRSDFNPGLTVTSAAGYGCTGLMKVYDKAVFAGDWDIFHAIQITSP